MKLPEWRPMPRQWNNDDDTEGFMASIGLIGPVVLIALGFVAVVVGLLL